jgi:ABC-type dipeptide/oligopeptide/nickel transport system permease component
VGDARRVGHPGEAKLIRYLVRRILLAIPTLFGIVVLVFLLLHLAPGSPASAGSPESGRRV